MAALERRAGDDGLTERGEIDKLPLERDVFSVIDMIDDDNEDGYDADDIGRAIRSRVELRVEVRTCELLVMNCNSLASRSKSSSS